MDIKYAFRDLVVGNKGLRGNTKHLSWKNYALKDIIKAVMQGKLIAVAYTLRTY